MNMQENTEGNESHLESINVEIVESSLTRFNILDRLNLHTAAIMFSVVTGRRLMSLLIIQRMVNMKVIATETHQRDTHLMDKMVMLTNMIGMTIIMENQHVMTVSTVNLVKD